ncbi:hypothetical protein FOMPIDRAFT_1017926 [Fomitopsis schrenkii]|uniref:Protein kinase domain-containing protein n=1 Tax=Fomitopsis schrenkii TaxID=2126942 RepID=S8F8Q8_FOMSC|nr:hypothetical protein FOMPIDRAFT_1017926 [Fomitopsis schrenkii]
MAAVGPPLPSTPHAEPIGTQNGVYSSHTNTTQPFPIEWKMALSPSEIVQAMQDVVQGHQAALEQGVLHRDLSEGNVLITGSKEVGKRVVIIDFDYAKMLGDAPLIDDPISGTCPFISGEILKQSLYFQEYFQEDDDNEAANDGKEKPILIGPSSATRGALRRARG